MGLTRRSGEGERSISECPTVRVSEFPKCFMRVNTNQRFKNIVAATFSSSYRVFLGHLVETNGRSSLTALATKSFRAYFRNVDYFFGSFDLGLIPKCWYPLVLCFMLYLLCAGGALDMVGAQRQPFRVGVSSQQPRQPINSNNA